MRFSVPKLGAHRFPWLQSHDLPQIGASCSACSKSNLPTWSQTEYVQGGQARRPLSATQAGSAMDFCSHAACVPPCRAGASEGCHKGKRTACTRRVPSVPHLTPPIASPAQGWSVGSAASTRSQHLWRSLFAPVSCFRPFA